MYCVVWIDMVRSSYRIRCASNARYTTPCSGCSAFSPAPPALNVCCGVVWCGVLPTGAQINGMVSATSKRDPRLTTRFTEQSELTHLVTTTTRHHHLHIDRSHHLQMPCAVVCGMQMYTCARGDLHTLRSIAAAASASTAAATTTAAAAQAAPALFDAANYDGRTALHVAAAEGQVAVVKFLLAKNVNVNPVGTSHVLCAAVCCAVCCVRMPTGR
jgi:hypothetical protein